MSELLNPRNVAIFAVNPGQAFGAICPTPLGPVFGEAPVDAFSKCWRKTEWGAEKVPAPYKRIKVEKISPFRAYRFGEGLEAGIALDGAMDYDWIEETIEQTEPVAEPLLDKELVARYHELSALGAQGRLSEQERAELADVQCRLDDEESACVQKRTGESTLDEDIERLKQLIELSRQVASLV